jgi:hypothetical protein
MRIEKSQKKAVLGRKHTMFYLIGTLILLGFLTGMIIIRPDLKRYALLPALIFIPIGPVTEMVFFRDYWTFQSALPYVNLLGIPITVEDVLFSFASIGIISISYEFFFRQKPAAQVDRPRWKFAIVLGILTGAFFLLTHFIFGLNSIFASGLACIIGSLPIFILRKDLRACMLGSSLVCSIGAFCFYFGILQFPGAREYLYSAWKLSPQVAAWRVFDIPVPLTEVFWAGAAAFFFSVIYKYATGAGQRPPGQRVVSAENIKLAQ